mmetsp:Transcript_64169/g.186058  ORF Transcript_64169/g.186058 Transcript_64169/m.186058 type:complete len:487 (+) Transcript_64169:78-1538(+)
MALAHSASDPSLLSGRSTGSSSALKNAGARALASSGSAANLTTNNYDKMLREGKFHDYVAPNVRPAGKSTNVALADSTAHDLQSEIHFPLPPTPDQEKRFRMTSKPPGTIHVHHGLHDQTLPHKDFRYGMPGCKGVTTEDVMKAGQLVGVAEYKNSVAERVYDSLKKEPLGKPYVRGHSLRMLPEGFGNPSGVPVDVKRVIFPVTAEPETDEHRAMYKKTHKNYAPGERIERSYRWPRETQDKNFAFGAGLAAAVEGAGAKMALNMDVDDDGAFKRTRLVTKVNEDYRHVQHPKFGKKAHPKQGPDGPSVGCDYRFGIKSSISEYTAASCIKGYYDLADQLPDEDLGRCTKPGRRNVTSETRAFGVPSVRTDIPAPHPQKRSVADECSYGDEPSAAAILNPQRFESKGIADREFLVRRPKEELQALLENAPVENVDFESLWEDGVRLFDDGLPLVSLDALLYLQSQRIDGHVAKTHKGLHLTMTAQ